ncbi:MAG: hypothetical protein AAFW69_12565 [Pseudomonadota bacterium]
MSRDGDSGIAILGWGSLIWDLEILEPHVAGGWAMGAGPALPLEFSRVSPKRKRALAVCIDGAAGAACPTNVIASARGGLSEAAADLAARERAPGEMIGAVGRDGVRQGRSEIAEIVGAWCAAMGWAGAVWTDLRPNFATETGVSFTVEAGRSYLQTLTGESLAEAHRYIESAPAATDTPLRRHLAACDWWQGLG